MEEKILREFNYIIKNEQGVHARTAALLVREANRVMSNISIILDGKCADARDIFKLMDLETKCGDIARVVVEGADETETTLEIRRCIQVEKEKRGEKRWKK